jgi:hypothetical protein
MRAVRWAGIALVGLLSIGCKAELEGDELVAAKADQTLRQLMAGMNARKLEVLGSLLVLTSTTGGAPRALRPDELDKVVFPKPPFTYAGPGKPGYLQVRDGDGAKHQVHLVVLGGDLKVVAKRSPLGGLGAGLPMALPGADAQVVTFLEPAEAAPAAK